MTELNKERATELADQPYSRADVFLVAYLLVVCLAFYIGAIHTCFNNGTSMCFGSTNSPPDFAYLWTISYLQHSGDLSQLFDPAYVLQLQIELTGRTEEYAWLYPPQSLFLVWPLSLLPLVPAYLLWVGVGLCLLFLSCLSFTRFRIFFVLAALLSPALFINTFAGHNGLFTAALLIGGILLASRRPIVAGILFGLLTFKPQLGLLVPVALIAARLWRPIISATVTTICLILASISVHGTELWTNFVVNASASGVSVIRDEAGPFTNLMPTVFMAGRILELPELIVTFVQAVVALLVMGATYVVIRRNNDPFIWVAVVSVGTFLVSPTAFVYDTVILAVGTLLLACNSRQEDFLPFERVVLVLLWLLPVLTIYFNTAGIPIAPLILAVGFVYVVLRGLRGHSAPIPDGASQP